MGELPARAGVSAAAVLTVDLPAKRAEALGWVVSLPESTARELEETSGLRKIAQRLSELERQGLIRDAGVKTCSVTGRAATTWRATGNPPRMLERKPTSRERIQQLEDEVVRLRSELAEARAARGQLELGGAPVWRQQ